jgi:hypothetical protein
MMFHLLSLVMHHNVLATHLIEKLVLCYLLKTTARPSNLSHINVSQTFYLIYHASPVNYISKSKNSQLFTETI